MLYVERVTKKENKKLISYFKKGPNALVRARAQTILMSAKGIEVPIIATALVHHQNTVRHWIHAWNEQRISSIFPEYDNNENAAKLTKAQREEIRTTLKDPGRLPDAFWTLPALKNHISTTFGVTYESARSYHYLLRHCGYSWKLPTPFDVRRDDVQVTKRMAEIRSEIAAYLEDTTWEVFVADEVRIDWEEETRRAWLPRGEKTVIKLERTKEGQSYFGALSLKTKTHHLIPLDWQDTDNMIQALTKLQKKYPDKHICMVWDNARWHKSKALRAELKDGRPLAPFHLINFPPYAPDENPEEHVWKYGKEKIANMHFDSFDDLKRAFTKLVNNKSFDYKM